MRTDNVASVPNIQTKQLKGMDLQSLALLFRQQRVQVMQQCFDARAQELEGLADQRMALSQLMVRLSSLKRGMEGHDGDRQRMVVDFLKGTPENQWPFLRELAAVATDLPGGGRSVDYGKLFWISREHLSAQYEVFRADATERVARLDDRIGTLKSELQEITQSLNHEVKTMQRIARRQARERLGLVS